MAGDVQQGIIRKDYFDYLIFGHRHLPLDIKLGKSRYINLGEWIHYNSYAVFDGENLKLEYFEPAPGEVETLHEI